MGLSVETKFHASVGVVTGLCAGRFGVRFLVGTRGISHLQNNHSAGEAYLALIQWTVGWGGG